MILVVIFCLFDFLHCFLMSGFGLSCTLFLRVLFSPALVLHFCLVFIDLILRVWSLRFCFLGCVFITACVFRFFFSFFTSYLRHHYTPIPSILLPPSSLCTKNTPSLTFFLLRNSNFHPRRSTLPTRPERSSQETFLRLRCPWFLFHHHCCQEIRS